jgi:hypothetical protein
VPLNTSQMNPQITLQIDLKYPSNWLEALADPTDCVFNALVRSESRSSQDCDQDEAILWQQTCRLSCALQNSSLSPESEPLGEPEGKHPPEAREESIAA